MCSQKLTVKYSQQAFVSVPDFANFDTDLLFHLPTLDRLVHVPFGLQAFTDKALGLIGVRRLDWPGDVTKNMKWRVGQSC